MPSSPQQPGEPEEGEGSTLTAEWLPLTSAVAASSGQRVTDWVPDCLGAKAQQKAGKQGSQVLSSALPLVQRAVVHL